MKTISKNAVAVLFPGIGYTNDRSLLYFSGRLAEKAGYKVIKVSYCGFPAGVKGDREKMRQSFFMAKEQAEEQLKDVEWGDDILFISKSIGTIVASAIAKEQGLKVRSVIFTPLADTFGFLDRDAIVFHGTADPWAVTDDIREACGKKGLPLFTVEGANHSLETGDAEKDVAILEKAVKEVAAFLS